MTAARVRVKFCGSRPHARRVQYGAPEPPEKRDHCEGRGGARVSALERVVVVVAVEEGQGTHEVLVRVDVAAEAELLALAEELDDVVEVGLVVLAAARVDEVGVSRCARPRGGREGGRQRERDARSSVLDGLPGRDDAQAVEPPPPEPLEVVVGLVELEDAADKAHVALLLGALPEAVELVPGLAAGRLGRRREVDAAQEQGAAVGEAELGRRAVHPVVGHRLARDGRGGGYRAHVADERVVVERDEERGEEATATSSSFGPPGEPAPLPDPPTVGLALARSGTSHERFTAAMVSAMRRLGHPTSPARRSAPPTPQTRC